MLFVHSKFSFFTLRNLFFLFIFSILFINPIYSQDKASISGRIIDADTQKNLPSATVVLLNPQDSSIVSGAVSDKNGEFNIKASFGKYLLQVKFVGYETHFVSDIVLEKGREKLDLGNISLAPTALISDEVMVTAEKENVAIGIDKRIFNVTKDLVTTGGTAVDVLRNLPSVSVDNEGNVQMNGTSVKILIDGKESHLSSDMALQSIPADLISSVELITNPSAKYEAEGVSGIIDIILKTERDDGFNALFAVHGGAAFNFKDTKNGGASFDGNYKFGKFNIFGNLSSYYYDMDHSYTNTRQAWQKDDTTHILRDNQGDYGGLWTSGKLGLDYNFDKKTVLTYFLSYNGGSSGYSSNSLVNYTENNIIAKSYNDISSNDYNHNVLSTGLNFKKSFGKQNHTLWADIYYSITNSQPEGSSIMQYNLPIAFDLEARTLAESRRKAFNAQVDYIRPIKYIGDFETGAKFRLNNFDEKNNYDNLINQIWKNDFSRSDNYNYNERISSFYMLFSNKISSFSYKLGMRLENTDYEFLQKAIDTSYDKNYWSVIPTVHLAYNINEANSFRLNYSRRLQRPWTSYLNPRFILSTDSANAYIGNADLKPEYYNSYEFSYMLFTPHTTISLGTYYRNTDEAIESLYKILENGVLLARPENLTKSSTLGVNGNFMQVITDWWRVNLDFNYYKVDFESSNLNKRSNYNWNTYFSSSFEISDNFNVQLTSYYYPTVISMQSERDDFYAVNLGARYQLLDKKLSIGLNFNNLLYSEVSKSTTYGNDFYSEYKGKWSYRSFSLNISYKLNDYKEKYRRENMYEDANKGREGGIGEKNIVP